MSGHTPGPWALLDRFPMLVVPACDRHKALGWSVDPEENARKYTRMLVHEGRETSRVTADERKANARLIAAAPDLLAACEELLRECANQASVSVDEYVAETGHGERAGAAIAKARGEGT